MPKHLSIVFYVFMVLSDFLNAQSSPHQDSSSFIVGANVHAGFILPHTSMVRNLLTGYIHAFEINWTQRAPNLWDRRRQHHGDWGFSLYFVDFGNRDQLGRGIGIYPFYNFPVLTAGRIRWVYRIGGGLGYLTKTWDRQSNYKNIMIGTHFNAILAMHTSLEFQCTNHLYLNTGAAFTHFSNGAVSAPNLGINNASLKAGIAWRFGGGIPVGRGQANSKPSEGWSWRAQITAGTKQIGPADKHRYFASSASIERRYRSNRVSGVGIMGDLFYNTSLRTRMSGDSLKNNGFNILQGGIMAAYEASIGRWMIIVGNGAYVYSAFKGDGPLYHRIGTRFDINDRISINLTLKTHWFKADFIETGINLKIR